MKGLVEILRTLIGVRIRGILGDVDLLKESQK